MNICPACQQANSDGASVCQFCNYNLDPEMGVHPTRMASDPTYPYKNGDIFAERYRIEKELGRGGMGVVYQATDLELLEKQIALKIIHPEILSNSEALHRFKSEVLACQEMRHPSIVQVYDLKRLGEQRFYTMEYIHGRSLREEILSRKEKTPPFTLEKAAAVILPLLKALSYAHERNIIHRDIKPENIILIGDFPDIEIKVVDFGIAKTLSVSRMTQMAQTLGTAYYMAPEQQAGKSVSPRADLYSVGMVLYELLTGEMAVGMADPPSAIIPDLPTEIDEVVGRLLKPKPDQCYTSADEASGAIQRVVGNGAVIVAEGSGVRGPRSSQQRPKCFTNSLGMEFVWIEPGTFMMGSPKDEEGRMEEEVLHQVTLTQGFYMQTTPVTVGQWRRFVNVTGYKTEQEKSNEELSWDIPLFQKFWNNPGFDQTDDHPVTYVSWKDIQVFIQWMNGKIEGVYDIPTEAQWEYAARAGSSTRYFFGDNEDYLNDYVWYAGNCDNGTRPVAEKRPNAWGLFDMLGNVWEFCLDWDRCYPSGSETDPVGTLPAGDPFAIEIDRIRRGGGCGDADDVRCAFRFRLWSGTDGENGLGFRLLFSPF